MRRALFILVCFLAAAVTAQEEQDRHFVKITHTSGYTVAVDSMGQEWFYDVESGEFVDKDEYRGSSRERQDPSGDDMAPDDVVLPPEIRCTDIHVGDIVRLGAVTVDEDDRIEGSITSGRDVEVKGLVTGNVFSYRTVTITSTGEVRGDVIARNIDRHRGGRILGQESEVPLDALDIGIPKVTGAGLTFESFVLTGFFAFICLITIALFPQRLNRVVSKIEQGAVKSFFWGILVWFSILPLFVLLIITIVGIPIAILIFPFALIAAIILGYVAATIFIGKKLSVFFGWQDKSIYIISILGVLFIAIWRILTYFFVTVGVAGLDTLFLVIYIVVAAVALTVGIGAVASSKFGASPKPALETPGTGPAPREPRPVSPVTPPPPPKTEPMPPQVMAPPPPVPPPSPKSGNATDEGENPSNK